MACLESHLSSIAFDTLHQMVDSSLLGQALSIRKAVIGVIQTYHVGLVLVNQGNDQTAITATDIQNVSI